MKYPPFVIFSIYTNGVKLFLRGNKNNSDVVGCVSGIRALTAVWTIYLHVCTMYLFLPLQNLTTFSKVINNIEHLQWKL